MVEIEEAVDESKDETLEEQQQPGSSALPLLAAAASETGNLKSAASSVNEENFRKNLAEASTPRKIKSRENEDETASGKNFKKPHFLHELTACVETNN